MCCILQGVLRFTGCYFSLEGQYTDFSGLTIPVEIGNRDRTELRASLDFVNGKSFLFSSTLDRFDFQPSWENLDHSIYGYSNDLGTNFNWRGRSLTERLRIGRDIFPVHEFHLVVEMPTVHTIFYEVGGIVPLGRLSPITTDRIIRLRRKSSPFRGRGVEISSFGRRRFTWPLSILSIPCLREERWSFSSVFSHFGNVIVDQEQDILVDPSSLDVLLPMRLWTSIADGNPLLSRDLESGRVYADSAAAREINFSFEISPNLGITVRLVNKSLRFPDAFAFANQKSFLSGPRIPLRVRIVTGETASICIGKALLESYKDVYLDNIDSMIRLLPHGLFLSHNRPAPLPNHRRSALIVEDIFTDPIALHALFNMDSESPLLLRPAPPTNLDRGLLPWSFMESLDESSSRKKYELKFVRVNQPAALLGNTQQFRLAHTNLVISASLRNGLSISKSRPPLSDPRLYLDVEVRIRATDISIRIQERGTLLDIPPPAPLASQIIDQSVICSVCAEAIASGQLEQLLPLCGHRFHAACIYPWFHSGRRTCPNCRVVIPSLPIG